MLAVTELDGDGMALYDVHELFGPGSKSSPKISEIYLVGVLQRVQRERWQVSDRNGDSFSCIRDVKWVHDR